MVKGAAPVSTQTQTHTHTLWPSPSSLTKRKHAEFKDGEGTVWQQLSLSDLYPNTIMPRHQYDGGNNGDWKKVSDHYLPDNGMKGYLDKWKKNSIKLVVSLYYGLVSTLAYHHSENFIRLPFVSFEFLVPHVPKDTFVTEAEEWSRHDLNSSRNKNDVYLAFQCFQSFEYKCVKERSFSERLNQERGQRWWLTRQIFLSCQRTCCNSINFKNLI